MARPIKRFQFRSFELESERIDPDTVTEIHYFWLLPPFYTALLLGAAVVVMGLGLLRRPAEVPLAVRFAWGVLRLVAVLMLLVLFMGPKQIKKVRTPIPNDLWLVVDQSKSMGLKDAPPSRYAQASALALKLKAQLKNRYAVHLALVGDQGKEVKALPPSPTGATSPLGEDLLALTETMDERLTRAVVLLSDGRITHGPPLEAAAPALTRLGATVLISPLGKENREVDLEIQNLSAPQTVAQEEPFETTFTLRRNRQGPASAQVTFTAPGQPLKQLAVRFAPQETEKHLAVKTVLKQGGFAKLSVRVPPAPGETQLANNQQQRLIKVNFSNARSVVVWGKPDPALGAMARFLAQERGEVARAILDAPGQTTQNRSLWKGPQTRQRLTQTLATSGVDLLVLGETQTRHLGGAAAAVLNNIRQGALGGWWIYGSPAGAFLNPRLPAPRALQRSQYRPAPGPMLARLLGDNPPPKLAQWPPLRLLSAAPQPPAEQVVLWATSAAGGAERYPLLVCSSTQGRQCALYSPDFWTWFLAPQGREQSREEATVLFRAVADWLTDKSAPQRLLLNLEKTRLNEGEKISATAEAYGSDFDLLKSGKLNLTTRCPGRTHSVVFQNRGKVSYASGPLPAGPCTLTARLSTPDGQFVTQKDFVVEKQDIEMSSTSADPAALKALAAVTQGRFLPAGELTAALEALKPKPVYHLRVQENDLARSPWPLAVLLAALTLEWAWRRRRGVA